MLTSVEIKNLTKIYTGSHTPAIDNLNLHINDGEFFALLGPSGSGKSTILRCLAGFEDTDNGEILFDNNQVNKVPIEKRNVGMVFQNYALFPHMTVKDNVSFGLKEKKIPKKEIENRVDEILDRLGIKQYEKRFPKQLSGGQQQRVAIARVLVMKPTIMLLDEPLANLDAKLRREMRYYIRSLQKEVNITTIFVTHDQTEAIELADRIGVLFDGELHDVAEPEELYQKPRTRRVAEFIGTTNIIEGIVLGRESNFVKIDTNIGELYSNAPVDINVKEKVGISIRPEEINIQALNQQQALPDHNSDLNLLKGKILNNTFLGDVIEYQVAIRIEGNQQTILNIHDMKRDVLKEGTSVLLSFRSEYAWVLKGEI